MEYKIGLIHGDGIGPEIVNEAKKVLDSVCEKYGHTFTYENLLLGGASIDATGLPLTEETVEKAKSCDAVLMGSIGGDAKTSPWYKLEPPNVRRRDCWESGRHWGFLPISGLLTCTTNFARHVRSVMTSSEIRALI